MITLDSFLDQNMGWLIPVILLLFFGAIVLIVILVKKYAKPFKTEEKPKTEKEIAAEELDRVLQPIEDEEAKAEMEKFNQEEAIKKASAKGEEKPKGEDKPIGK